MHGRHHRTGCGVGARTLDLGHYARAPIHHIGARLSPYSLAPHRSTTVPTPFIRRASLPHVLAAPPKQLVSFSIPLFMVSAVRRTFTNEAPPEVRMTLHRVYATHGAEDFTVNQIRVRSDYLLTHPVSATDIGMYETAPVGVSGGTIHYGPGDDEPYGAPLWFDLTHNRSNSGWLVLVFEGTEF